MSLLHPNEDDDAFASANCDSGLRKAWRRIERLEDLLLKIRGAIRRPAAPPAGQIADFDIAQEIDQQLRTTCYDEQDDGQWRFPRRRLP